MDRDQEQCPFGVDPLRSIDGTENRAADRISVPRNEIVGMGCHGMASAGKIAERDPESPEQDFRYACSENDDFRNDRPGCLIHCECIGGIFKIVKALEGSVVLPEPVQHRKDLFLAVVRDDLHLPPPFVLLPRIIQAHIKMNLKGRI